MSINENIPNPPIPNNVISLLDWKTSKNETVVIEDVPEEIEDVKPRKRKMPPVVTPMTPQEQQRRSSQATSYLIEVYTDLIKLAVQALGEIERLTPDPKSSKIAHDTIATVSRIINQVAIDLQVQQADKNDS